MCWTHWQFSIKNIPGEQLVGLLGFGRMLATLPTYVHPPRWCTEDPAHGERKYITSRRYQSILKEKKKVSEPKRRTRLKLYGQFQAYRCAIKHRFLDTGARDILPAGGERWAMFGRAVLISFPPFTKLLRGLEHVSYEERAWGCLAWRREGWEGISAMLIDT